MRITCPYCQSDANLSPNPANKLRTSVPRYVLKCEGCDRTAVRRDPARPRA
jgi:transposase-like protein